ncbi:MAG: hypothetical protein WB644_14175 [Candidatus Cybelea sp.]
MIRLSVVTAFLVALGSTSCTSNCDNAGVSVDGSGNIIVRGENGFISPNSSVLKNVSDWPQPPNGEQNFSFSQGYILTRDGTGMYLLANTAQHPNLVYHINLGTGQAAPLGSAGDEQTKAANAASKETWIAADDRSAYSVGQSDAAINRADLSQNAKLTKFIAGPRTRLRAPIGVAVDASGRLCALDSETLFVLCYASFAHGDVAPAQEIDTKKVLGYGQVDDVAFDLAGHVVVAGTSDRNGMRDFSLAVFDTTRGAPRLLRTITGRRTGLAFPDSIGVDNRGNILVLQNDSRGFASSSEIIAFGPVQRGDSAPAWVRKPAATPTHAFRMAIDRETGDIAILGSDGIAYFPKAGNEAPTRWPAEVRLPMRGWNLAFGGGSLIVADEFGGPVRYNLPQALKQSTTTQSNTFSLHDPEFISTDQNGRVFVASTDGAINALPVDPGKASGTVTTSFATRFGRSMDAFAVDSAGYFYLSSAINDAIIVIEPGGHQSLIIGPKTKLNRPVGLAVSRDGSLLVANRGGNSILAFARGSTGNMPPTGQIGGSTSELIAPQALALDAAGKLYVFDGPVTASGSGARHYVRVYDVGARGDVAPMRSYPVNTKCWVNAP